MAVSYYPCLCKRYIIRTTAFNLKLMKHGDTMNCKRCGTQVTANTNFCPNCGLENPVAYWQQTSKPSQQQPTQNTQNVAQTPPPPSPSPAQHTQQSTQATAPSQHTTATAVQPKKSSPFKTILVLAVIGLLIFGAVKLFSGGKLKGTWTSQDDSFSITFSDSDSGYFTYHGTTTSSSQRTIDFSYYTEGNEIEIKTEATLYYNSQTERFEYSVSGKTLTLTEVDSGTSEIFYKK